MGCLQTLILLIGGFFIVVFIIALSLPSQPETETVPPDQRTGINVDAQRIRDRELEEAEAFARDILSSYDFDVPDVTITYTDACQAHRIDGVNLITVSPSGCGWGLNRAVFHELVHHVTGPFTKDACMQELYAFTFETHVWDLTLWNTHNWKPEEKYHKQAFEILMELDPDWASLREWLSNQIRNRRELSCENLGNLWRQS